jgi:hypothetical protein
LIITIFDSNWISAPISRGVREGRQRGEKAWSDTVKIIHFLAENTRKRRIDPKPYLTILEKIDQQFDSSERGDLLIFISGLDEITILADEIKQYATFTKRWIVLMLHRYTRNCCFAKREVLCQLKNRTKYLILHQMESGNALFPQTLLKLLVNNAQWTCNNLWVTIDGIRFCIDSGKVKQMGYDPETKMSMFENQFLLWL